MIWIQHLTGFAEIHFYQHIMKPTVTILGSFKGHERMKQRI